MLKKLLPACLVIASAFVLFACSKDDAPANTPETIVKNASDSAISGIYFRYTYKGHTELYKHPVDSVGFYYYTTINIMIMKEGVNDTHKSVPEFNFGHTWPVGTGAHDSAIFWIGGADTSYITKNMQYTIKRNGANFGDTVEVRFKGLVTEEDAAGTPDTATVTGDFRAVRIELDHF
jgi:hypothetical protein